MAPITHDDFEVRDLDRYHLERKEGKSIMQMIREGKDISEELLKEDELNLQLERKIKAERTHSTNQSNSNDNMIYDEEGKIAFND